MLTVTLIGLIPSCGNVMPASGWQDTSASPLAIGPYVVRAGPDRALVAFRPASRLQSPTVAWWTEGQVQGGPLEVAASIESDLYYGDLRALPKGRRIHYSVRDGGKDIESGSFRLGTAPGEDEFRFAAFGDTRTGHAIHRAVVEAMSRETVDFVVHSGDMVERGGKKRQWDLFFQIERPLLRKVPFLPAVGNHDANGRYYFERYFLHDQWTGGQRYYKVDWGNMRLVAIDSSIELRRGSTQYAFAQKVLDEGARAGMILVLFLHHPPYSSGWHGSQPGVQEPVTELARAHGVELVIAGHDHNYERTRTIDGTTYIVAGSAGAPIRPVRPQMFTRTARTEPHYVLIDVDRDRMTLRAINLQGETFDSAVIRPNPPRP